MARKSRKNTESVTAPVQESTFYATAIYVRLSIENSGKDYDGDSIANQISFCKNYLAEQTDLKLCDIYQDNGEKETNFDRLHSADGSNSGLFHNERGSDRAGNEIK